MRELEAMDSQDREDGSSHTVRLRQVPPETGRLLALLAAVSPPGICAEIGTSAGYSGLWISLACRLRGSRLVTFELLPEKASLARETFAGAGVTDVVELREGNAMELLTELDGIGFCFLDSEKKDYPACYDLIIPRLVPGGILAADNVLSHREVLSDFTDDVLADPRTDGVVLPVGSGVLVCRKTGS
jgi:predicted O-methyltransferase YrrM